MLPWGNSIRQDVQILNTLINDSLHDNTIENQYYLENIDTFLSPISATFQESIAIFFDSPLGQASRPNLQFNDSVNLADSVNSLLSSTSGFLDSIALSDSISTQLNLIPIDYGGTDSISLSDSILTQLNQHLTTVITGDSLSLSDSINPNLTETLNTYLRRYLNDVIGGA